MREGFKRLISESKQNQHFSINVLDMHARTHVSVSRVCVAITGGKYNNSSAFYCTYLLLCLELERELVLVT
jgi:hypothetical protein